MTPGLDLDLALALNDCSWSRGLRRSRVGMMAVLAGFVWLITLAAGLWTQSCP